MADEITIDAKLVMSKGNSIPQLLVESLSRDMTGGQYLANRQTIGTSEQTIELGDASVGGYLLIVNRDSTNFAQVRGASGETDLVRLEPGDVALFRVDDGATPYAIADTAAVELEYLLLEA